MSVRGIAMREAATLTGRCTITRGVYPDQTVVDIGVPCSMRPAGSRGTQLAEVAGGDQITTPLSGLRILATQDIARGDVVTVTTSPDPTFTGRYFTVVSVNSDTSIATRLVNVSEDQT